MQRAGHWGGDKVITKGPGTILSVPVVKVDSASIHISAYRVLT